MSSRSTGSGRGRSGASSLRASSRRSSTRRWRLTVSSSTLRWVGLEIPRVAALEVDLDLADGSVVSGLRSSCDASATNRRCRPDRVLDPVEHLVHRAREPVDLVAACGLGTRRCRLRPEISRPLGGSPRPAGGCGPTSHQISAPRTIPRPAPGTAIARRIAPRGVVVSSTATMRNAASPAVAIGRTSSPRSAERPEVPIVDARRQGAIGAAPARFARGDDRPVGGDDLDERSSSSTAPGIGVCSSTAAIVVGALWRQATRRGLSVSSQRSTGSPARTPRRAGSPTAATPTAVTRNRMVAPHARHPPSAARR